MTYTDGTGDTHDTCAGNRIYSGCMFHQTRYSLSFTGLSYGIDGGRQVIIIVCYDPNRTRSSNTFRELWHLVPEALLENMSTTTMVKLLPANISEKPDAMSMDISNQRTVKTLEGNTRLLSEGRRLAYGNSKLTTGHHNL